MESEADPANGPRSEEAGTPANAPVGEYVTVGVATVEPTPVCVIVIDAAPLMSAEVTAPAESSSLPGGTTVAVPAAMASVSLRSSVDGLPSSSSVMAHWPAVTLPSVASKKSTLTCVSLSVCAVNGR